MQSSRLLSLPSEVRTMIYRHVFNDSAATVGLLREGRDEGRGVVPSHSPSVYLSDAYLVYYNILFTCKDFYTALPFFAASVEITFEPDISAEHLSLAAQRNYFVHTQYIRLEYWCDSSFDVDAFPSLRLLELEHDSEYDFTDCKITFLRSGTAEEELELIKKFEDGANDDQILARARAKYFYGSTGTWESQESDPQRAVRITSSDDQSDNEWLTGAFSDPNATFPIVDKVYASTQCARGHRVSLSQTKVEDNETDVPKTVSDIRFPFPENHGLREFVGRRLASTESLAR